MRQVRQSWCGNDFISPPTAFSAVKQASAPPRPDQLGTTDEFRSAHGLGSTHNLGTADDLGPRGYCAAGDVVVGTHLGIEHETADRADADVDPYADVSLIAYPHLDFAGEGLALEVHAEDG